MRLLLDTQIVLWALTGSPRLGASARELIGDPANEIYVSTASIWEIAIKHALGRGNMPVSGALRRHGAAGLNPPPPIIPLAALRRALVVKLRHRGQAQLMKL